MPFVAADIGGTHARVALMRASHDGVRKVETLAYRVFACAEFPALSQLLQAFIDTHVSAPVKRCVLACAGQIMGDEVVNDNLAWPIHLTQLRNALGLDEVAVLNDFEALAYALDGPLADGGRHLCGPTTAAMGPTLVIGPGTGLGAAVHVPAPVGGFVLPTEAGQMDFAPNSVREREVLAHLAPHGGYVAFEHIVSGPGLLIIYATLCTLRGEAPKLATPEAVTAAAVAHSDAQAVEAVEIFCAALGSFTGNLAMAFMATGGVYLAGGFLSSTFELLQRSAFEERFLHGRSARALLSQIPVWVTEHGHHGVQGAAKWYLRHGMAASETLRHAVADGLGA
ncbi:glucokinase [Dyella mobilis]|uniref:Glucokinase n=1 Tax=Dyella mobilis TaxID=1849582 RepID=A0ABS2KI99_9GAMM|nr:glucokinase [Dyella mobilis]MBM7130669.1 glucokinase [Dyella mobilis]GLQ97293.1 glucokinase [Dyella mobilis]